MRNFVIIEAPSNLGLKPLQPGVEPGVKYLPEALRKTGFAENAGISQIITVPPPPFGITIDEESKVRNADAIALYSDLLAARVQAFTEQGITPVVIGGDCSILLGTTLGLKSTEGNYALFFMDGHTDYAWPEHSASGGAAGMDLTLVTGNGHPKLTNINGRQPYIKEEHVFAFGNRDMDPVYVALIKQSRIHYYDLPTVRRQGIASITAAFLAMVEQQKLDGFWIHLDADVLNNDIMPCVDSPEQDGLSYGELQETLQPLLASPGFRGMDITILDPTMDEDGNVTLAFSQQLSNLLKYSTT